MKNLKKGITITFTSEFLWRINEIVKWELINDRAVIILLIPTYGTTDLPPKGGSRCVPLDAHHYMPLSEMIALSNTKKEEQREDNIGEKAKISNTILFTFSWERYILIYVKILYNN